MFADPHGPNSTVFFTLDTVSLVDVLLLDGEWRPVVEAIERRFKTLSDPLDVVVLAFGSRYVAEKAIKVFDKYFEIVYPGLKFVSSELHPIFDDTVLIYQEEDFHKINKNNYNKTKETNNVAV